MENEKKEILIGHSYKLSGWAENEKIATVFHKGLDDCGKPIFIGAIRYKSPFDDSDVEYCESADWDENGMFHAESGPSSLDLSRVIGPSYPEWVCERRAAMQALLTASHNYLQWCRNALGAGPVGNPRTHSWHNEQIRQALSAFSPTQPKDKDDE